jgi:hypothetical protein
MHVPRSGTTSRWSEFHSLDVAAGAWMLTISLSVLLCVKLLQLINARGHTLFKRVDVLGTTGHYLAHGSPSDPSRASIRGLKYPARALFGRRLWISMIQYVIPFAIERVCFRALFAIQW